jgi:putative peptide zinc metalloprotease protein
MQMQEAGTPTHEEESPGLWDLLEGKVVQDITSSPSEGTAGEGDLWQGLQQRLDVSRRRPNRIDEYEAAHLGVGLDHEYYVLKNTVTHTFLKCTPQDFFLWEMMDGKSTVRDLAVAYFVEFGSFPFERLVRLIAQLGNAGFLEDKPVRVFESLRQRFEGRSWAQRLSRWANFLMHHELRFRNPDGFFDSLYRRGGWILFSKTAQALYISLTLVGLGLFLHYAKVYPLLQEGQSWRGVLWLIFIGYLVIPPHECAHGLACKHYGREVLGAGAMLYRGSLVFFVDTNDMWLAPKRARIAVSWAGPFSTVIIASVCSIIASTIATLLPTQYTISLCLLKLAFVCYLSALLNLNPLLEWDGYFMLMDYLEIPRLRQKALSFLRKELLKRLFRQGKTLSREESVFAVFGLLAALWIAIAFSLSLLFIRDNVNAMIQELRTGRDQVSIIILSIVVFLYGLPPVGGIVLGLAADAAAGIQNLARRASAA